MSVKTKFINNLERLVKLSLGHLFRFFLGEAFDDLNQLKYSRELEIGRTFYHVKFDAFF